MSARLSTARSFLAAACLAAIALACASGGSLPPYLGPARPGAPAPAAVGADVEAARAAIETAARMDRGAARARLAEAEARLRAALAADPHSRDAAIALGETFYRQGELGDERALRRCVAHLERVAEVDPDADRAALILARAYGRLGDADRIIYWAGYVESTTVDPGVLREMTALREPYQREFLTSWYEYGDYYASRDAVLREMDPATFQFRTIVQVTPDLERDLGARGLQAVVGAAPRVEDPETQKYLQELVDRIVADTPGGPPFRYEVDLVHSDEVNAMAVPGKILVNTGLLAFVDTEAELVAALSHEIAHVYAHHAARQMIGDYKRRILAGAILAQIDFDKDIHDRLLELGAAVTLELVSRGYSRAQEKEADRYGTHLAFNAGYNPTFMTSFFVRLYEANPSQPFKLLATHPPTTERIEYTSRYLESFPLDVEMQIDSEAFQQMRRRWIGR